MTQQQTVEAPAVSAPQGSLQAEAEPVLVMGIGNVLWADEGFGVRCVQAFDAAYVLPPHVQVVDGGTQGMYLLDFVCQARRVLVFDAIDYRLEPGALRVLRDREVPEWTDTAMSLHQATFQELLALARLRDRFPDRITLIGVQPVDMEDLGGSLSPLVKTRVNEALALAVAELESWGIACTPRQGTDAAAAPLLDPGALAIDRYEAERPSAQQACRLGDERFLNPVDAGREPGTTPGGAAASGAA